MNINDLKNIKVVANYRKFINLSEISIIDSEKKYILNSINKKRLDDTQLYLNQMKDNIKDFYHNIRNDFTINKNREVKNRFHKISIGKSSVNSGEKVLLNKVREDHMEFQDLVNSIGKQIIEYTSNDYIMIFRTTTLKENTYVNKLLNEDTFYKTLENQNEIFNNYENKIIKSLENHNIKNRSVIAKELTNNLNIHEHTIDLIHINDLEHYLTTINNAKKIKGIGTIELVFDSDKKDLVKKTIKNTTFKGTGKGKVQFIRTSDIYRLNNSIDKTDNSMVYFRFEGDNSKNEKKLVGYLVKYVGKSKQNNKSLLQNEEDFFSYNWELTKEELFLEYKLKVKLFRNSLWFWDTGINKEKTTIYKKIVKFCFEHELKNNKFNQKRSLEEFIKNKKENQIVILNWSVNKPYDWNKENYQKVIKKNEDTKNYINNRNLNSYEIIKNKNIKIYSQDKTLITNEMLNKNDHIRSCSINNFNKNIKINRSLDFEFTTRDNYIHEDLGKLEIKDITIFKKLKKFIDNEDIKDSTFFLKNFWINKLLKTNNLIDMKSHVELFGEELEIIKSESEEMSFNNMFEKNIELIKQSHQLENMEESILFGMETLRKWENQLILENYLSMNDIKNKTETNLSFQDSLGENQIDKSSQKNISDWKSKIFKERNEKFYQGINENNEEYINNLNNEINNSGIKYINHFNKTKNINNKSNFSFDNFFNIKNEVDLDLLDLYKEDTEKYYTHLIFSTLIIAFKEGHVFLNTFGLKFYSKGLLNDEILNKYKNSFNIVQDRWFIRSVLNNILELSNLVKDKLKYDNSIDFDIDSMDFKGITLHQNQREAVEMGLKENIMVLTGGAGSGKTTTSQFVIKALEESGLKIMIVAPTGSASNRISQVSGMESFTIHKALKLNHYGVSSLEGYLEADCIIVDESSMIDNFLAYQLLSKVKNDTKLIFLGDVNQLPPVSNGQFFKELVNNPKIPTVKLTKTFRQSGDNPILKLATEVLNNECSFEFSNFLKFDSKMQLILDKDNNYENYIVSKMYDLHGKDFQIISQTNRQKDEINKFVQKKFNQPKIKGSKFHLKDKVINLKNDYNKGIFNGDTGLIHSSKILPNGKLSLLVIFDNGIIEDFIDSEIKNLDLAYCITIHKSQGMEYKYVLVVGDDKEHISKNLLYTAITRAKEECIVYMQEEVFNKAIKTNDKLYLLDNNVYDIPNNNWLDI